MQAAGVAHPSKSPYSSLVVLVKKMNGCMDYCKLNEQTKLDTYALLWKDDTLGCLLGSLIFATLLSFQVLADCMSFAYPDWFEFTRMPFGLWNSPAML